MSNHFAMSGGGVYSVEHGQVLDAHVMRFAEVLHDYNEYFELQFVPANAEDALSKPYRVVDNTPGIARNVVRYMTHQEMHQPAQVLAEIWKGDLRYHSAATILSDMEIEESARKLMDLKKQEEKAQEDEDLVAFYLEGGKDGRHYLNYNGHKIAR